MTPRKEIYERIMAVGGRPNYESGILEALLDIRDLMLDIRELLQDNSPAANQRRITGVQAFLRNEGQKGQE